VLSFLEPRDILRAAQTCRYWKCLSDDNLLWREKCAEAGVDDCRRFKSRGSSPWKVSVSLFRRILNALIMHFIYYLFISQLAYLRKHKIEMNWRVNPVKPSKILKGHDDHVITCLQFSGTRIVSGSDDNTLKVWSVTTGKVGIHHFIGKSSEN
jgi:F-box/WD-40 domain protein 7